MQESASLVEAAVAVHLESQLALAKRKDSAIDPVRIGSVLIVDDYAPWRQRVCSMLRHYAEAESISESADRIEAVGKAHELKPDLILLDLQLPRLNGIEAAKQIGEVAPDATILFVSMNKDADVVREALKTGAKGYVLKQTLQLSSGLPSDPFFRRWSTSAVGHAQRRSMNVSFLIRPGF